MGDEERSEALLQKIWERVEGLAVLEHRVSAVEKDNTTLIEKVLTGNGEHSLVRKVDEIRRTLDFLVKSQPVPRSVNWEKVGKAVIAAIAVMAYLLGIN